MQHSMRLARRAAALATLMMLTACVTSPDPTFYLLEGDTSVPPVRAAADPPRTYALREVTLPRYARDLRIATRTADGTVARAELHRWAERPERAITEVLADTLKERTSGVVLTEPWPAAMEVDSRIEVVFDHFLGSFNGPFEARGQYRLLDGRGTRVVDVAEFACTEDRPGQGFRPLMDATARAVQCVGQVIGDRLSVPGAPAGGAGGTTARR